MQDSAIINKGSVKNYSKEFEQDSINSLQYAQLWVHNIAWFPYSCFRWLILWNFNDHMEPTIKFGNTANDPQRLSTIGS